MMQAYNLNNLIKETTCFQPNNHSQIDLILTNQKSMYKFSNTFETDLSDHHKHISTIWKSGSFQGTPWIKVYPSYKFFSINYKSILNQKLNNLSSTTYDDFEKTFLSLLNKHAPLKKKYYDTIMAPVWPKNFERKSWKDLNSKISITKKEIMKTGPFIKNKEITVYHYWGKLKNLTLKNWTLKK